VFGRRKRRSLQFLLSLPFASRNGRRRRALPVSRKHVVFAAVAVWAFSRGGFALPSRRFKALADEEEPPDVRQLADIIFSAVTVWGGPDSADGVEFIISSSFTLDLDPFFTAMQSAAYCGRRPPAVSREAPLELLW